METPLLTCNGPTAGRRGTEWLLWSLSILYGIAWYPALFIGWISPALFAGCTPLLIVLILFEILLPCALAAGVIGGWICYAKGDVRKAQKAILAPLVCLVIVAILAYATAIKESTLT